MNRNWAQTGGPPEVLVPVDDPEAAAEPGFLLQLKSFLRGLPDLVLSWVIEQAREHPLAAFAAVYALMRAMGVTVRTGTQGLLFSFGRARKVIEPGFHFLIPFLQVVRIMPTRHRTLDLQDQKVATLDGLVYRVHATLVWRTVDITRSLVEIGDLQQGMRDALAISVWEVLRERDRAELRVSEKIDDELALKMARWLEPWGVVVERAGFQSIAPSPRTLALIQLRERVHERQRAAGLIAEGAPGGSAIALVGTPHFPRRRQRRALQREVQSRYRRRVEVLHRRAAKADVPFKGLKGRALARARASAVAESKKKARLAADRGIARPWSVSAGN
ncbi:SPFH domain-containing protein [Engelhardtia mirabilis]|uniref:Modulator of FtsH protease HflC n=1 Tax=Engelhardtia mirabilis TaxID=2528011 RepID=A0A518BGA7_9BACT|nr:Modulator of FtsH protease HflC [Planctomycetes bacterium Pla133]QDV00338.1 Modulator of FtsH protease HflC [Planctomycetes bacterium Pla86]